MSGQSAIVPTKYRRNNRPDAAAMSSGRRMRDVSARALVSAQPATWKDPAVEGQPGTSRERKVSQAVVQDRNRTQYAEAVWREVLQNGLPLERAAAKNEGDVPLGVRSRTGATLRDVFKAVRAGGLRPHPFGEEHDDAILDWLGRKVQEARRVAPTLDQPVVVPNMGPGEVGEPVAGGSSVPNNPVLGVNELNLFDLTDTTSDVDDVDQYNWWFPVFLDACKLNVGHLRHFRQFDVDWLHLFSSGNPDEAEPIYSPQDLYLALIADNGDGWGPFGRLQERLGMLLLVSCLAGIQVVPTLFTYGGSNNLLDSLTPEVRSSITNGRPRNQPTPLVPCSNGWAAFYHDFEAESHGADERTYQQYALNVNSTAEASPYMAEAARRKALGIAAYGLAIGEFLAVWRDALLGAGIEIRDVVPYVECGNEMVSFLCGTEYGKFMSLLAGPIRFAMGADCVRFRAAEVASWVNEDSRGSGPP